MNRRQAITKACLLLRRQEKEESLARFLLMYMLDEMREFNENLSLELAEEDEQTYFQLIDKHIKDDTPLSHLVGFEYFYDRKFKVTNDVLSPRMETEELIYKVIDYIKENDLRNIKILDLCTGSGIIGITLKKELEEFDVEITASDISSRALTVAKENANSLEADISFVESDLFSNIQDKFDIIVSNPPYIAYDDKKTIKENVLNYDPHLALFADEEGMYFYRNIIEKSRQYLTEKGIMFFEIGYDQKEKIIMAYKQAGEIVGYMGDGINDSPAIKQADVGVSVNTAADTAKDAASIVLLQNSLKVLVSGISEGRRTFINTLKYIFVATSANFGNMFSMAGASLFLSFLPLLPKQILLTNLLTDFPSLQIASDSVDEDWLKSPVKWDTKFIKKFMILFGIISSVFDYITFALLLFTFKADERLFHTGWLLESIISAMVVMLIVRTARPVFASKPSNKLLIAISGVAVVLFVIVYSPISSYLGLIALPIKVLISLLGVSLLYALTAEILKKFFYKHNSFSRKQSIKK